MAYVTRWNINFETAFLVMGTLCGAIWGSLFLSWSHTLRGALGGFAASAGFLTIHSPTVVYEPFRPSAGLTPWANPIPLFLAVAAASFIWGHIAGGIRLATASGIAGAAAAILALIVIALNYDLNPAPYDYHGPLTYLRPLAVAFVLTSAALPLTYHLAQRWFRQQPPPSR
jgi:hypothetical protein